LVREDGKALYLIYQRESLCCNNWVNENVIPVLYHTAFLEEKLELKSFSQVRSSYHNRAQSAEMITAFLQGDDKPHFVADWPVDIMYLCKEMITGPGTMIDIPGATFEVCRVDAYPCEDKEAVQHNALWDAYALKLKLEKN
jgi:hypothetical protein